MCGICGIRRFGDEPITEEKITTLLCANERRGLDATGMALQNPGEEVQVLKQDEPANHFVRSRAYKEFLTAHLREETEIFLGHTRAATQGNPKDNANNHPVFAGNVAVVHNGMIHNDDTLFRELSLDRKADVDSDILRAILDEGGFTMKGLRALRKISGSVAIAAIANAYPGKLVLARSGSPLVLASTPNLLVWSSEKQAIHNAMRPFVERHGLLMQPNRADLAFITMNNDSIYMFGERGLEWHDEFRVAKFYTAPDYGKLHDNYRSHRTRYYDEKTLDVVECPGCKKYVSLTHSQKNQPLWELVCTGCNTFLAVKELKA